MSEFNFSGGCGTNISFLKICEKGSLCLNCVEAWACEVKYESLLKENTELKTVSLDLVDALIISKLEEDNNKLIATIECLTLTAFEDGYNQGEDRISRGDGAWENSHTKKKLEELLKKEWVELKW